MYDVIGAGYDVGRRPDSGIRDRIWKQVGAESSVVNVGARSGAYEDVARTFWLTRA